MFTASRLSPALKGIGGPASDHLQFANRYQRPRRFDFGNRGLHSGSRHNLCSNLLLREQTIPRVMAKRAAGAGSE